MPTSMTSREIVRRCIEFRDPPRIGWHFATDPIRGRVWNETDFACVGPADDLRFIPEPGQTEWVTEWGVRRRTLGTQIGEAVGFPLADGWHLLDTFQFPDYSAEWRWTGLRASVAASHRAGKYVYGHIPSLMLLPIDLRGMENWFMDHVEEPENLTRLLDRITAIRATMIERYATAGVNGVMGYDDWGLQDRMMVGMDLIDEFFKPHYEANWNLAHDLGMDVWLHSCGYILPLLPRLHAWGLNVIQQDQQENQGLENLNAAVGGKLAFWCPVDIQQTMIHGSLDDIRAYVRRMIATLGSHHGGLVSMAYSTPETIHHTPEKIAAMCAAFRELGEYAD